MAQVFDPATNPTGLNGVEFIEYTGPDMGFFEDLFKRWGFKEIATVSGKKIKLYRQHDINFIINCEPATFAEQFAKSHGPAICSVGFRFHDADFGYRTAIERGGKSYEGFESLRGATPFKAISGIGGSLVYFMDRKNSQKLYNEIFKVSVNDKDPEGPFSIVDHFTNNVPVGEMQKWCDFYTNVFGFRETRYFDIKGAKTGLISKVMRSPCGLFAVPINEPTDTKSQIQEYLDQYHGSGIQHLALLTNDIVKSLTDLKSSNLEFLSPPPATYYAALKDRLPMMTEDIPTLRTHAVLADGDSEGYLLQIFSKNIIGPIFFEVIQRKGHSGFGEGNFQALFDAIERDQTERGYL